MQTTGHDSCRTQSERVIAFVRRFFPSAMALAILFVAVLPASGTYFMYRAKPPKFLFSKESALFAKPPRLNRPFEYRKMYMPHMVSAALSRAKSLPQFDLRARPQTLYDIRIEDFIAGSERLIREGLREMDTRLEMFPPLNAWNYNKRETEPLSVPNLVAVAQGVSWQPSLYAEQAVSRIAAAASTALGRDIRSAGVVPLDGKNLAGVRLLILSSGSGFDLSKNAFDAIIAHMRAGGFLFLDRDREGYTYQGFVSAVNRYAVNRPDAVMEIVPLPANHPLASILTAPTATPGTASTTSAPIAIRLNGKITGIAADYSFMSRWSDPRSTSTTLESGIELLSFVLFQPITTESAGNPDRH